MHIDRDNARAIGVILVSTILAMANMSCASAGAPEFAIEDGVSAGAVEGGAVEMIVINRTAGTVTAFVQWTEHGTRMRLGQLSGRETRAFMTPYRGTQFRLDVDVQSSPPPATFGPGSIAAARRRDETLSFVEVFPGERYEWEIRETVPSVVLFFRRLSPR